MAVRRFQSHEKYYRNWVLSEQILGNKRKNTKEHQAAWHAAGMLYFSDDKVVRRMWSGAVAKQIIDTKGIKTIHHSCFPHLQTELEKLTDDFVKFHCFWLGNKYNMMVTIDNLKSYRRKIIIVIVPKL